MVDICPDCGLPEDGVCICESDNESEKEVTVRTEKRKKFTVTVIEGNITEEDHTKLKNKLGCGGSFNKQEEGGVMLQGDHQGKVEQILENEGYYVN